MPDLKLETTERVRALSLLSGGLDSRLAVCVLRDQGIDVHGVVFDSPFFSLDAARAGAAQLDIPLHVVDFTPDIVELLQDPPHGFGSCLNPCVDCHARMIQRAGQMMDEAGFHFLATGEVLNERPMSQNRRSLAVVAEESGYGERLVRPLSAALLPETRVEREGHVDRSRLLALQGRSRKPQFELAERYGLKEYPSPAGGCRLTEPNFCKRLQDLREHEGLRGVRNLELLRYGRHFRLDERVKLIVGRNEADNAVIEGSAELYDIVLKVEGVPGPTGLMPFTAREEQIRQGGEICARYSDARPGDSVTIRLRSARGSTRMAVKPAGPEQTSALLV
jgi:tRNA U34 2-thiouridine synthase MnmA/TrmU